VLLFFNTADQVQELTVVERFGLDDTAMRIPRPIDEKVRANRHPVFGPQLIKLPSKCHDQCSSMSKELNLVKGLSVIILELRLDDLGMLFVWPTHELFLIDARDICRDAPAGVDQFELSLGD